MHLVILFLFTFILQSGTLSLAHENQLSGLLYMEPQTPIPNEPFTITFELYDPEGKFIPSAILNLAIPSLNFQESFIETSQSGIYQMNLVLPKGHWFSDITEATFEGESNTIQIGLKVGEKNREIIEILFPVINEGTNQQAWHLFFLSLGILSTSMMLSFILKLNTYTFKYRHNYRSRRFPFTTHK